MDGKGKTLRKALIFKNTKDELWKKGADYRGGWRVVNVPVTKTGIFLEGTRSNENISSFFFFLASE